MTVDTVAVKLHAEAMSVRTVETMDHTEAVAAHVRPFEATTIDVEKGRRCFIAQEIFLSSLN